MSTRKSFGEIVELSYEKSINDLFPKYEYIDITEHYKIIKAKKSLN